MRFFPPFHRRRGSGLPWSPYMIPQSLIYGRLDAEIATTVDQTAGVVTNWTDAISGNVFTQATAGAKPVYSATSFNGRPGITFDGTADNLRNTSALAWPMSGAWEVWALVKPAGQPSGSVQNLLVYPNNGTGTGMAVRRAANTNQITLSVGNGAANVTVSTSTSLPILVDRANIIRAVITGTVMYVELNGVLATVANTAVVPSLSDTNRHTIGASGASTPNLFGAYTISSLLVTAILPAAYAVPLYDYLDARRA